MPVHRTKLNSKGLTGVVFLFKMIINYGEKRDETARKVRQMRYRDHIQKRRGDVTRASCEIITLFDHIAETRKLQVHKCDPKTQCRPQISCRSATLVFFDAGLRQVKSHAARNDRNRADKKWQRHLEILQPIRAALAHDESTGQRCEHHRHAGHREKQ